MLTTIAAGNLQKMVTRLASPVEYRLPVGETEIALNPLIGQSLRLAYNGEIHCCHCGRKTKKSFNQGYCYPCFQKLAQCDSCIVSPEKCHYFEGTCREPEWADQHCMQKHYVYLANSSGVKVGITRGNQVPTRWMDQGAVQALPVFQVENRLQSGLVEVILKQHVADKTNWQAMLKGDIAPVDLAAQRDRLFAECQPEIAELQQRCGVQNIQPVFDAAPVDIHYPVLQHPVKVKSLNFDKQPIVEGQLLGIKGQYLIFDIGVINIRKFGAYYVEFSA